MDKNAILLEIVKYYPSMEIESDQRHFKQATIQSKINKINSILTQALEMEKPNFTQLQLALQEITPNTPDCYRILRMIMENRFKLEKI